MTNSKIMKCWNCGTDISHQSDEDNFFWCNSACREVYEGGIRQMDEKLRQGGINGHEHRTGTPADVPASVTRLEPEPVTEGVPTSLQFPQIQLPPEAKVLPPVRPAPAAPAPDPVDPAPETLDPAPQPVNLAPEPLRVPTGSVPKVAKNSELQGPAPGLGSDALPIPEGASKAWPAAYPPNTPPPVDPAPETPNPAPEPLCVPVEPVPVEKVPTLSAKELHERVSRTPNTGKPGKKCGNCGELGHNKRTCPRPKTVKPAPVQAKRCSNCGKAGHNARTCKTEAAE